MRGNETPSAPATLALSPSLLVVLFAHAERWTITHRKTVRQKNSRALDSHKKTGGVSQVGGNHSLEEIGSGVFELRSQPLIMDNHKLALVKTARCEGKRLSRGLRDRQ